MALNDFFISSQLPQQRTFDGVPFPAVLSPNQATPLRTIAEFSDAIRAEKARVESLLKSSGAVLFRGFPVQTAADFNQVVEAFGYEELPYVGGAAPRTNVVGRVFTANESPPDQKIPFHHEMAQVLH
jgi:Taurine catabolism dioxygenase TauD, TfdA family